MMFTLARPVLHALDPETAHQYTIKALKLMPACAAQADNSRLVMSLWGKKFSNPVGLAAGFDKNADVISPMLSFGFGFVEAGTVTPLPQEGNPRPRVFRDPSNDAVINRMGFPGGGLEAFRQNFLKHRPYKGIAGINIGMNKTQTDPAADYTLLVRELGPMADYLTVNISSPNTPGLRDLQKREALTALLKRILDERQKSCGKNPPPLLVKLAPDLDEPQQEEVAQAVMAAGIDGLILGNTTLSRPEYLPPSFASEKGGLSGKPLTTLSTKVLGNFYQLTEGKLPLIGAGGVSCGNDAYEKIRAGASLVQLYTALVFKGPGVVKEIKKTLIKRLDEDGFATLADAVGADHRQPEQKKKYVS